MTTHLVLGGTSSGKSDHAQGLALATGGDVVCIATGRAGDAEMDERVEAHRDRRPAGWGVDETADIPAALHRAPEDAIVLVDDLEGWIVERMSACGLWTHEDIAPLGVDGRVAVERIVEEADAWWCDAGDRAGDTIVVAGQPGVGIIPLGAANRRYVDVHGRVTQRLAARADRVTLVVAGRGVPLQALAAPAPSPPSPPSPPRARGPGPGAWPASDPSPDSSPEAGSADPLRDHGDRQVPPGTLDLAVNVLAGPPVWLRDRLAVHLDDLADYPDDTDARTAIAARHGRDPAEVVPLPGAAEGFWALPRVLGPRLAVCVHPGFTEPEAALREAGVPVLRVQRDPDTWRLHPDAVPDAADLVVLGRPDNPTGMVDPIPTIAGLCRPGRTVVVDEAFAEFLPDADGLAGRRDLPGLVVLRSFTKLWGLAGLRVGYLLAPAALAERVAAARQPWAVDTLALAAMVALADPATEEERRVRAQAVADARSHLLGALRAVPGVRVWDSAANFVLLRTALPDLRERLLEDGIAVRRGETFPGLASGYVRIAVRTPEIADRVVRAIARQLTAG